MRFDYMEKAKKDTTKLVKKVITNKKGKQQTVYVKPFDHPRKNNIIDVIMNWFGFKDRKQAEDKIREDFQKLEVAEKFNLTIDAWAKHIQHYFENREKWAAFFAKAKSVKTKDGEKTAVSKKDAEKIKGRKPELRLSVMKFIHELYGEKKQQAQAQTEQENNFETMPESEARKESEKMIESLPVKENPVVENASEDGESHVSIADAYTPEEKEAIKEQKVVLPMRFTRKVKREKSFSKCSMSYFKNYRKQSNCKKL
jgi:hypothetical protein